MAQSTIGMCLAIGLALIFHFSIHRIEEGHVGVYFRVSKILVGIGFNIFFIQ